MYWTYVFFSKYNLEKLYPGHLHNNEPTTRTVCSHAGRRPMKLTAVVLAQPLTIPAELLEERNHCRVVMIGETGARHKRVQVTHVLLLRHYSNNNLRHARFPSKSINKGIKDTYFKPIWQQLLCIKLLLFGGMMQWAMTSRRDSILALTAGCLAGGCLKVLSSISTDNLSQRACISYCMVN